MYFAPVAPQRFFDLPRLKIRAVEHGHALARALGQQPLDGIGDEKRFVLGVEACVIAQHLARARVGPQPFALALFVVGHQRAGRFQNVLGRAVILFQANGAGARIVALEIQDVANVGSTPAIDRTGPRQPTTHTFEWAWVSSRISSYCVRLVS